MTDVLPSLSVTVTLPFLLAITSGLPTWILTSAFASFVILPSVTVAVFLIISFSAPSAVIDTTISTVTLCSGSRSLRVISSRPSLRSVSATEVPSETVMLFISAPVTFPVRASLSLRPERVVVPVLLTMIR